MPQEGVWLGHIGRVSVQNHVLELNAMLRHAVDQVEMEVAQKVGVIDSDDVEDPQRGMVKGLDDGRHRLSGDHVALQETEDLQNKLLNLEPLLKVGVVLLAQRIVAQEIAGVALHLELLLHL